MKQFAILENQEGLVQAVRLGRNNLAMFLPYVWAGLNGMWLLMSAAIFSDILFFFAKHMNAETAQAMKDMESQDPNSIFLMVIIGIVVHIVYGLKAAWNVNPFSYKESDFFLPS